MQQLCLYNEDLSFRTLEAYKTLRSNIEFSGKNIRTITVTSCTPNEGKSEVSFESGFGLYAHGRSEWQWQHAGKCSE